MDMGTRPVYCIRLYRAIYWSLRDNMIDVLEKPYIKAAKVRESTHFALLCSMLSKMLLFLF